MCARWLWTQKQDIGPSPRYGHAMAYDAARQRVALFGGLAGGIATNDTWEWNAGDWTQVSDMGPAPRWHPGMTYDDARQRFVLFGGLVPPPVGAALKEGGDTWE